MNFVKESAEMFDLRRGDEGIGTKQKITNHKQHEVSSNLGRQQEENL